MENAKIRIKIGSIELDYEGDPAFLKDGMQELLQAVAEHAQAAPFTTTMAEVKSDAEPIPPSTSGMKLSTAGMAAALSAKSCADLVMAALGKLQVVDGLDSASRKEVHAEMKTATGYFKQSMKGGNLTGAFDTLVKAGRINPLSGDKYSLRASEREQLEKRIADVG